jgi:hypothetical protein
MLAQLYKPAGELLQQLQLRQPCVTAFQTGRNALHSALLDALAHEPPAALYADIPALLPMTRNQHTSAAVQRPLPLADTKIAC